mmetsp:Transcript_27034/g.29124  ORF Transcript_27034/g.29124 Transcript_27034/m.29124 type:complete len:330 (-) Transcript_27034:444-1433(-)
MRERGQKSQQIDDNHIDKNAEIIHTQDKQEETGSDDIIITCNKRYSNLKYFLSKYLQFIQNPYRQDSILKTVQYSLWFLSKFYRNKTVPGNSNTNTNSTPHRIAEALLKLSKEISWARYVLRFFGLPVAINGVDLSRLGLENNSKRLGQAMSWSMIAYFPLEHLAYLCWKAPSVNWLSYATSNNACQNVGSIDTDGYCHSSSRLASTASAWSCRFWLTYLLLDIFRCTLALRELKQNPHQTSQANLTSSDSNKNKSNKIMQIDEDKEVVTIRTEHLQVVRNILYVLPALHWSLPNWDSQPWLPDDIVSGLCWLESMVGLFQGVRNFQQT